MQRVRIGLTGLACVFLLVLLAASLFGLVGRNGMGPSRDVVGANAAVADNGQDSPKEPLAELGVAPGNAPDHPADNAAIAPAAAVPAKHVAQANPH